MLVFTNFTIPSRKACSSPQDSVFLVVVSSNEIHSARSEVPFLLEQRRDLEEKRQAAVEEQMKHFERGMATWLTVILRPEMCSFNGLVFVHSNVIKCSVLEH